MKYSEIEKEIIENSKKFVTEQGFTMTELDEDVIKNALKELRLHFVSGSLSIEKEKEVDIWEKNPKYNSKGKRIMSKADILPADLIGW